MDPEDKVMEFLRRRYVGKVLKHPPVLSFPAEYYEVVVMNLDNMDVHIGLRKIGNLEQPHYLSTIEVVRQLNSYFPVTFGSYFVV